MLEQILFMSVHLMSRAAFKFTYTSHVARVLFYENLFTNALYLAFIMPNKLPGGWDTKLMFSAH